MAAPWGPHSAQRVAWSRPTPGDVPPHWKAEYGRARAISDARLSASPRLHLRPIDLVVYEGPYRREDSSRDWLPA